MLDVLADQGAKATFFTVGNRIDGRRRPHQARSSRRPSDMSHSFDHAAGDGQA
ncbi:MAG: hypothetical protein ACLT98_11185 [Eggerthellaceae bacterium]